MKRDPNEFRKIKSVYIIKVTRTNKETGEVSHHYLGKDNRTFGAVIYQNLVCLSWNNKYIAVKKISNINEWDSFKYDYSYELLTYDKFANAEHSKFSFAGRESISKDYVYNPNSVSVEKEN